MIRLPRVYLARTQGRARRICYRHIIHSLAAKPQAFRFSQFRDDILPSADYRQLWSLAEAQFPPKVACKWIVSVLRIAYDHDCEQSLATTLLADARRSELPELDAVQARYRPKKATPAIPIRQHAAVDYDRLLEGQWAQEAGHG